MSTLTINATEININTDSRFRSWAKIVNDKTIDLTQIGGY